ncbi:uncharacterized protein LOC106151190 [Lingula anatina]|uniref:Uncharacterized protein LOC106151190 n=1 Tax=Lingula anatina TaxID=7574 RepID=A0A1S3H0T8_LINAN|nr:uncharacterized protein LOC106151190 [Lingula anatina]|eukprot:XP_013379750.1 uncharacterized protein LOC106151190 [Lingula anatina]
MTNRPPRAPSATFTSDRRFSRLGNGRHPQAPASPTTKKRRIPTGPPPTNFNCVRRKIMLALTPLELKLKAFHETYLAPTEEIKIKEVKGKWVELIDLVFWKNKQEKSVVVDMKHLETIINKYKNDKTVTNRAEHAQILHLIERHNKFLALYSDVRHQLLHAVVDNLENYCISFFDEAKELDIQPVQEYEDHIISWGIELHEMFNKMVGLQREIRKWGFDVIRYVRRYDKILSYIQQIFEMFCKICKMARRWLSTDELFPRRLQQEVEGFEKRKREIQSRVRSLQMKQNHIAHEIHEKKRTANLVNQKLKSERIHEADVVDWEINIQQHLFKTKDELEAKETVLKDLQRARSATPSFLTSEIREIDRALESVTAEIKTMENHIHCLTLERSKVRRSQSAIAIHVHQLENEAEDKVKTHKRVSQTLSIQDYTLRMCHEEIKSIDIKVAALRRILQLKLSPESARKIYFNALEAAKSAAKPEVTVYEADKERTVSRPRTAPARLSSSRACENPGYAEMRKKGSSTVMLHRPRISSAKSLQRRNNSEFMITELPE